MKYCVKCGKELLDEAVMCPECGNITEKMNMNEKENQKVDSKSESVRESSALANLALAFAFLNPIVGFILGIIGSCRYRRGVHKDQSRAAIFISVAVEVVVSLFIFVVLKYYM